MMSISYDDNPYYSDLRKWLYDKLNADFPRDGMVVQDTDPRFLKWTGMNHKSLVEYWKKKPTYTTCVSFLSLVHTRICDSGLATRSGARGAFAAFALDVCGSGGKGWHTLAEDGQWPSRGDFFQTWVGGKTKHVGVFIEVYGNHCSVIAGGGGVAGVYQTITRTPMFPANLKGWLDIDQFYAP